MTKTLAEKWKSDIVKYRKQCQSILKISNDIRYVGAINEYGRTLTGIMHPHIRPILKKVDAKNEFFTIATLVSQRKHVGIGKLDHIIFEHQKITILILQKSNITYYISIHKNSKNLKKIILSIKKII